MDKDCQAVYAVAAALYYNGVPVNKNGEILPCILYFES